MTEALIDADLVAYRCAASAEDEEEFVALSRCKNLVERILQQTNATTYTLYLSGSGNFRKEIDPEYKANRKDTPRPKWLQSCREYLVTGWKAKVTDGIEADDALGIAQREDTIICSLDKDLLQIPGSHFRWEISGPNWTKQAEILQISQEESLRRFWTQTIVGDVADNVFGIHGMGPKKTEKLFVDVDEDQDIVSLNNDYYGIVKAVYNDDERLHKNCKLLWVLRTERGIWQPPTLSQETNLSAENSPNKESSIGI